VHFRVEPGQVEAVGEVVLVDFAKVFVAACCYELEDLLAGLSLKMCSSSKG